MAALFPEDSQQSEDLLNCLICTEPFKNPRVLPCHHTFCLSCLDRYFATTQQEGNMEPGTFPCPVCRQVVNVPESGIEGLTLNCEHSGSIQNLVEKISTSPAPKRVNCDVCKYKKQDVVAKDHCASCGINYCGPCSLDHSKHCLFKTHSVVPVSHMDKASMRCELHAAEAVKFFCQTCLAPLCTVCAVTEHQTHDTKELHLAMEGKKEAITDRIGDMSEKVSLFYLGFI